MIVYNDKNNETYLMHKQHKYIKKFGRMANGAIFIKHLKANGKMLIL